VDLFGPGVNIVSAWINSSTQRLTGSSEAAPHVAGAAALYKATYGDNTSGAVGTWLVQNAQPKVRNVPTGTTNRLLYKGTL
jgi:subtilisin family serine protease